MMEQDSFMEPVEFSTADKENQRLCTDILTDDDLNSHSSSPIHLITNISDEINVDGGEADDAAVEKTYKNVSKRVYLPNMPLEEGTELIFNPLAYHTFHEFKTNWPCLTFDILYDSLGDERIYSPHSLTLVAGTQADHATKNKIFVMRASNLVKLGRKKKTNKSEKSSLLDISSGESDGDDEEDVLYTSQQEPILTCQPIPTMGAVNRIRSWRKRDEKDRWIACWSDTGRVNIYNIAEQIQSLNPENISKKTSIKDSSAKKKIKKAVKDILIAAKDKPFYSVSGHREEGFGLDWSPTIPGRLLSGDGRGVILMTELDSSTSQWTTRSYAFKEHQSTVEDIQWSPVEQEIFSSCSADHTVKIWDTRNKASLVSNVITDSDVNVISWNRNVHYLLASGHDDGSFSTWDLRYFKSQSSVPVATFQWHTGPITSLEWHPTESSILAVSGADHQCTLWDFSLEEDAEIVNGTSGERTNMNDVDCPLAEEDILHTVPPQLLFIHQGQKDMKELHWHPQIPGLLLTTALTGFNLFKTVNI